MFRDHQNFNSPQPLLWIHTAFMQSLSVKEIANQLYCGLRGRETKTILLLLHHTEALPAFCWVPPFWFCFGVFLSTFFSFITCIWNRLIFPNQLCRHDLRIRPYLVTIDRHDLLTIHGRLTRTPTPASKWYVHEAMSHVASPCLQSLSQHSWTNVVWMYTVMAERLLRIPEP